LIAHEPTSEEPTVLHLQNALATAKTEIEQLKSHLSHLQTLQNDYNTALTTATEMARNYNSQNELYISELHTLYSGQLLQARQETVDAQIVHQEWQARLEGLETNVRKAFEEREKEGDGKEGWRRRVAALREENRVLRMMAGWDPPLPMDSDDEEEAEEELLRSEGGSQGGVMRGERAAIRELANRQLT
jgi:chromosome segregation ATPase